MLLDFGRWLVFVSSLSENSLCYLKKVSMSFYDDNFLRAVVKLETVLPSKIELYFLTAIWLNSTILFFHLKLWWWLNIVTALEFRKVPKGTVTRQLASNLLIKFKNIYSFCFNDDPYVAPVLFYMRIDLYVRLKKKHYFFIFYDDRKKSRLEQMLFD